jgi:pilus assembly protein CpaE
VHDGRPLATIADVARDISRLDASLLAASTVKPLPSFSLLPAPEELAQAAEVRPDHVQAILALAVLHYDFVVLDLPRTLDALTINALDRASRIFAVMQAGLPDLRNATRVIKAFRTLGYPEDRVELILNRHEKTSAIGLDHIQRTMGSLKLHTVANAWKDVVASINHGDPLVKTTRSSQVTRQLAELARQLQPTQEETRGLLGRLFRRA